MSTLAFLRVSNSMGLTLLDLIVLYEVRRIPGCKMSDISRSMRDNNPTYAYQSANRLADKDLLNLGQSRPGKQMHLTLTMAGAAVLNELEDLNHAQALFPCRSGDGSNFRELAAGDQGVSERKMA
jgi:DNA-binding MarR family transcriptional regulator